MHEPKKPGLDRVKICAATIHVSSVGDCLWLRRDHVRSAS